jgi:putative spermidine/putrescine transport system ATP-binding protein
MISIRNLKICYGQVEVVPDLNVEIARGEFFTLLGPSGCGKTTVLRAIAGFVPAKSGQILLDGTDVTHQPAEQRDVGIVFQNYALFPHMTVRDNISFGLKVARKKGAEIRTSVDRMLEVTGIAEHANKKPEALSGGQQQRVAIARSLVMGTQVLLFDEPLSNLDARVRDDMRKEIKRLQRELDFTAVFVTHDQEEALSMSDRLLVFSKGVANQIGTSRDLYSKPATPFVCEFIGASNKLGEKTKAALGFDASMLAYLRPEEIMLAENGDHTATITDIDFLGPISSIEVRFQDELLHLSVVGTDALEGLEPGGEVRLNIDRSKVLRFENGALVQ